MVDTDTGVAGEAEARHVVSDEDVSFVDEREVKEGGEGGAVEDADYARVDAHEERECRRHVCSEDSALVGGHSVSEEGFRALEPEVVEAVFERAEERGPVAARDSTSWEHGGGGGCLRRHRHCRHQRQGH